MMPITPLGSYRTSARAPSKPSGNCTLRFSGFAQPSRCLSACAPAPEMPPPVPKVVLEHAHGLIGTEVDPPDFFGLMKPFACKGFGYSGPLGEDNAYQLEDGKRYLTGTSEVGIVAMQVEYYQESQIREHKVIIRKHQ